MSLMDDVNKKLDAMIEAYEGFAAHKMPNFPTKNNCPYVLWGDDPNWMNNQPGYYDWLYNSSSKHHAIIDKKVMFIAGDGWRVDDLGLGLQTDLVETKAFLAKMDSSNILTKWAKDRAKHGGFCWEPIFSKDGKTMMPHYVPFAKVRVSKEELDTEGKPKPVTYFYTSNWFPKNGKPEQNKDYTALEPFDPMDYDRSKRYLVYFADETDTPYPLPEYTAAVPYIAADYEVGNFVFNNTKRGFVGSYLFNFYNGKPDDDQKQIISDEVDAALHGSDNAGTSLKSFQEEQSKGVEVSPIGSNGQDDRYVNLNRQIREEIFSGHVIDPIVVGLKGETGFSNNADEKRVAVESFQNYYVYPKQREPEAHMNLILRLNELKGRVYIQRLDMIQPAATEVELAQILSLDERRERAGYAKSQTEKNPVADSLATISPLVANKILESMTLEEIRGLVGLVTNDGIVKEVTTVVVENSKDDVPLFTHFAGCGMEDSKLNFIASTELAAFSIQQAVEQSSDFMFATLLEISILKLLIGGGSIADIAKALKQSPDQISKDIDKMTEEGLVNKTGQPTRAGIAEADEKKIFTVYKYMKRRDASGPDIIEGSRDFCRNMVALSRTRSWTLEEIKTLNNGQGLDVFSSRGGWFKLPNGTSRPSCRHVWSAHLVTLK